MTENEMVGWHHRLDVHEFDQALGVGDGQGSLAGCSPWECKELNSTEPELNCTDNNGKQMKAASRTLYDLCYFFMLLKIPIKMKSLQGEVPIETR